MPLRCLLSTLALLLTAPLAGAADGPSRMLFVTQSEGFRHKPVTRENGELAPAEIAMRQLGQQTGLFTLDATQDVASDMTPENLAEYDIVAFYTTGDLPLSDEAKDYFFNDWAKQEGHGIIGIHSAADTFHNYEPYWDLMGGTFIGHAWNAPSTVTFRIHDPDSAVMQPFVDAAEKPADDYGDPGYVQQDEIYQYRHWQPEKVRTLMSLDYSGSPTSKGVPVRFGYHVPVAWVKANSGGKLYFNNLGHRDDTWTRKPFLESIAQAVRWFRGEVEIDATPNPEVSAEQEQKAQREFEAGDFSKADAKIK